MIRSTDNRGQSHHREAKPSPSFAKNEEKKKEKKEEEEERKSRQKLAEANAQRSQNKVAKKEVIRNANERMKEVKKIQDALDKQKMLDSTKVFSCTRKKCKKTFSSDTQLKAHERTHAIDDVMNAAKKQENLIKQKTKKKCTAPGCKKSFKSEKGLADHVKDVHSEAETQLKAHEQSHPIDDVMNAANNQENSIKQKIKKKCTAPGCKKSFKSEKGLKDHMKDVHS